ncbi:hypothetical protein KAT36_01430 [Candidatus Pacearchaeota archaeon]|nr:hypothetical protein [Candidatus Pacearchaeota archaeon]
MGQMQKLRVLTTLYSAMENVFANNCHGVCDSNYDKTLKATLDSAESLKLTWGDFYDLHYQLVGKDKQKQISELINSGLENQIIKEENEGVIKIGSPVDYSELSSSMTLGEAYRHLIEEQIGKIIGMQINKKFPEDELINSGDLSKAENYFEDNLRPR